jgi:EmrB/QacA subfamily drug resistance transporter
VLILIVPTSLAPSLGPPVGGILVDHLSWHWIFWFNGPIGLLAILFGIRFLREQREANPGRFDLPGFALSATGLALSLYALTDGARRGWGSPSVVAAGTIGLAALVLLVVVELRRQEPLLKLRLLGERLFGTTNLASFFGWAAYLGWLFAMPLYLQQVHLVSAEESGVTTFVEAVGVLIGSRFVGRIYPRIGPRRLVTAGMLGIALALFACTTLTDPTPIWGIRLLIFACGCAMSAVLLPCNTAMFARISHSDTGRASAIFNTQRRTAAAFGVAMFATVLTSIGPTSPDGAAPIIGAVLLPAFRVAFAVGGCLALVGMLVALAIRDADAADTMRQR